MRFVSISNYVNAQGKKDFDCGDDNLNAYLQKYAAQNESRRLGRTFLLLGEKFEIIGYYTLATAELVNDRLSKSDKNKLPKYPIPCLRICRLAVDLKYQGKRFGELLLQNIIQKVLQIGDLAGIYAIIVEPKENAVGFYEHYGFKFVDDGDSSMLLLLSTCQKK